MQDRSIHSEASLAHARVSNRDLSVGDLIALWDHDEGKHRLCALTAVTPSYSGVFVLYEDGAPHGEDFYSDGGFVNVFRRRAPENSAGRAGKNKPLVRIAFEPLPVRIGTKVHWSRVSLLLALAQTIIYRIKAR